MLLIVLLHLQQQTCNTNSTHSLLGNNWTNIQSDVTSRTCFQSELVFGCLKLRADFSNANSFNFSYVMKNHHDGRTKFTFVYVFLLVIFHVDSLVGVCLIFHVDCNFSFCIYLSIIYYFVVPVIFEMNDSYVKRIQILGIN